ncbi:MAG TPA: pitrilysin family protein [Anaeromyxobacteraceae bacterium]|jgi:zinc protease
MMLQLARLGAALAVASAGAPADPRLDFEAYRLPNGLHVILHVDRAAPLVGVDVRYDVGSKDERPGRTGFAHLFEHLMFQGSVHLEKGAADRLIEAAGGSANGATSEDATEYWQQVPPAALEQALFVEADRMGFTLPALDPAKLENQREVVRNERRQHYEMQPYGGAWPALRAALWDEAFPYHWLPIGSHADLAAATPEDVREWFRRWYGPGNASLAIAGDFDPAEARRLVERWFGGLPASATPPRERPRPRPLPGERRISLRDDVQLPRLHVAWQTPAAYAEGDAALDLLGEVLATGKSSRLQRRLVMEERVAQDVWAGQNGQRLAGSFVVVATPKPGVDPERILGEVDEEIARIAREPPAAAEIQRALNRIESSAVFALEPVGGFGGRAAALNRYFLDTGDPGYLPRDLARYRAVTPEAVSAAAARWLGPARVVLTVLPRGAEEGGR